MENQPLQAGLNELFSQNTLAKILRTASQGLMRNVSRKCAFV